MKFLTIPIYMALALFFLVLPVWFRNPYWIDVINNIGLYAILGLSINIIVGHTGLFNLGHAAFYAMGAYTTAILNTVCHIPILWLIPLSGLTAGLFALIVARPIIHLRGDYLCIVTIGVGEIVRIALINDVFGITGGANGVFGIDRPRLFGMAIRKPHEFYYLIAAFLAVTVLLFHFLENSRFGRALNYIREDEIAASGCGIDTAKYKLGAFVIGAVWAGMAGNIFAAKMRIIAPGSFSFWESVLMFTIVILGGSGSMPGVILGAFLVIGLPELFRDLSVFKTWFPWLPDAFTDLSSARMLVFGAAMILMMIFRNKGLWPSRPRTYKLPQPSRRPEVGA